MTEVPALRAYDPEDIGRRIWAGDRSVVAVQRARFNTHLIPPIEWAMTLYSFRRYAEERQELRELAPELLICAQAHLDCDAMRKPHERLSADGADAMATYLLWLRRELSRGECYGANKEYSDVAMQVISLGKRLAHDEPLGGHTIALLSLTEAECHIRYGEAAHAERPLRQARYRAPRIADPNQRNRVYRKLSMLYLKNDQMVNGWRWGLRAITMRGIPWNVRLKSIVGFGASCIGIELL